MAVLKRKVSSKAKGFTPYAGDEPPRGVYRARVVKGAIRASKEKSTLSYNIMVEFEATKPEHKKFDGYVTFAEIWLGEHEALQAREASFIKAVTGKDDFENVNVAFTGKEADFKEPSGAPITAIDGKKIEGKIVNVEWRWEAGSEGYEGRMRANSLFPWNKTENDEDEIEEEDFDEESEEDEDADGEEEADEDETDEDLEAEIEERRKELRSRKYSISDLRAAAKAAGADTKGMKKDDLVEAILDYEFGDAEDEDEDAETDEDEDGITEDDIETDDDEDDEDEEDEDDEEEEDEDESENLEEVLRKTASDLDRAGLKKAIKEKQADFVAKKSQSDDDLREVLVQIWLTNPPF